MLRALILVVAGCLVTLAVLPAGSSESGEPGLLASLAEAVGVEPETVAAVLPSSDGQLYYQYVENGKPRFVLRLEDVPEKWRDKAGRVRLDGPPPDSPEAARAARAARTAHVKLPSSGGGGSRATVNPNDFPEVVVYTTQTCPHCRKALAHLDRRGVPYVNKDVENDSRAEKEYLRKGKGRRGVPLIDVGGEILRGYSPKSLDSALDRHG